MNDDPDAMDGLPGALPHRSSLSAAGLRLASGTDVDSIARLALEAIVPALADAAGVFAAEQFLRGSSATAAAELG